MHELAAPRDRQHGARQLVARDVGIDPLAGSAPAAPTTCRPLPAWRAAAGPRPRPPRSTEGAGQYQRKNSSAHIHSSLSLLASARLPKLASARGKLGCELRNQRGTSNSMILVRFFEFEAPKRICRELIGTSNSPHWRQDSRFRRRSPALDDGMLDDGRSFGRPHRCGSKRCHSRIASPAGVGTMRHSID